MRAPEERRTEHQEIELNGFRNIYQEDMDQHSRDMGEIIDGAVGKKATKYKVRPRLIVYVNRSDAMFDDYRAIVVSGVKKVRQKYSNNFIELHFLFNGKLF